MVPISRAPRQPIHLRRLTPIHLIFLCMVVGVVPALAVSSPPPASEDAEALVRQLGDPAYKMREEAAQKLVRMGRRAEAALKRGLWDTDAEVRRRCEQLLPPALQGEARIVAFLRDEDGRGGKALPGWERFTSIVGTGRDARLFFADMWRADPDLMEGAGRHERGAGGLWVRRCVDFDNKLAGLLAMPRTGRGMGGKLLVSDAELGALLFVASDPGITLAVYPACSLSSLLRLDGRLRERDGSRAQMLRKLCVPIVLGQHGKVFLPGTSEDDLKFRLIVAMEFELGEGVGPAVRALETRAGDPDARATAAAALAKLRGRVHLPLLEAMLDDGAALERFLPRAIEPRGPDKFQVRDVALAMLVDLTGQKHCEYGFLDSGRTDFRLFDSSAGYAPVGFADDSARQRALAKWKVWRRAHPGG
jgi:hypothetical protein